MAPLSGLTRREGPVQQTDQGVLEAHGGPADPSHGAYGSQDVPQWPAAYGTGYQGTRYPWETDLDEGDYYGPGTWGRTQDATPDTHSSPYPRGIPQTDLDPGSYARTADVLQQQRHALHGTDMGAVTAFSRAVSGRESPVDITVDRYDAPNATMLAQVPGQLRQGNNGAGRDTSQGYGQLNATPEFQAGHSIRIIQHDTLHFDHTLSDAPPQPFWGRHEVTQASFDGPDSPYGIAGDTSTGQQVVWEGRIGTPTAYAQPPEPAILQAAPDSGEDSWPYYG